VEVVLHVAALRAHAIGSVAGPALEVGQAALELRVVHGAVVPTPAFSRRTCPRRRGDGRARDTRLRDARGVDLRHLVVAAAQEPRVARLAAVGVQAVVLNLDDDALPQVRVVPDFAALVVREAGADLRLRARVHANPQRAERGTVAPGADLHVD